jgi:hypothetical protein
LLNQLGPPLLIDQPEEDLDNPVMQEIVEQLWKAKQKRQIIFVSHNANLVVNGDAELVAWCDYRKAGDQSGGKIAGEGAIDVPEVREAIKRIMEGGEAAFNLRREIRLLAPKLVSRPTDRLCHTHIGISSVIAENDGLAGGKQGRPSRKHRLPAHPIGARWC